MYCIRRISVLYAVGQLDAHLDTGDTRFLHVYDDGIVVSSQHGSYSGLEPTFRGLTKVRKTAMNTWWLTGEQGFAPHSTELDTDRERFALDSTQFPSILLANRSRACAHRQRVTDSALPADVRLFLSRVGCTQRHQYAPMIIGLPTNLSRKVSR